ncbi:hypothetical protein CR513_23836, partial [Mucuna pruriens]
VVACFIRTQRSKKLLLNLLLKQNMKILLDLGVQQLEATTICCNSKLAIAIAENPLQHEKTKHIQVKFNAICEAIQNQEIKIHFFFYIQLFDILIKALPRAKFEKLRRSFGVSIKNVKEC